MIDTAPPPAFMDDEDVAPVRAVKPRPIQREHARQKHAKLFVRDVVTVAHKFLAFDRTKKTGRFSHMRQKARGIQPNTPDTQLCVVAMMPAWCEWKDRGKEPDGDQLAMLEDLRALGHYAFWCDSIVDYCRQLRAIGVPMRANAELIALDHDLRADGEIAREEMKRGVVPKRRGKRYPAKARTSGITSAMMAGLVRR